MGDWADDCERRADLAEEARMDRIHVARNAVIEAARNIAVEPRTTIGWQDLIDAVRTLEALLKERER